jgi:hypothetical protein
MDVTGFCSFLLLAITVTVISYGFDRLYAEILTLRLLYYAIRMPGIVLHELAHCAGCLVTGAGIRKVVLFSKEGGSVTYAEPKIPLLGTVIISTAPLLVLPLLLSFMTGLFPIISGSAPGITLPSLGSDVTPSVILTTVTGLFITNLFVRFNSWFLLYLYLCTSIILSLAPSRQDLANAAIGIILIAASCLIIITSGYGPANTLLDWILVPMAYAFTLGLIFELIVAVGSLPLILIWGIRKGV